MISSPLRKKSKTKAIGKTYPAIDSSAGFLLLTKHPCPFRNRANIMKKLPRLSTFIFLFSCCISCSADTANKQPVIPLSVDHVETHRVGEHLVRVIQHNMELLPQIDLELLSVPTVSLIDSIAIDSIQLDGKERRFSDSSGVFIEGINIENNSIQIKLDYYFSDEDAAIVSCSVRITDTFQSPECSKE